LTYGADTLHAQELDKLETASKALGKGDVVVSTVAEVLRPIASEGVASYLLFFKFFYIHSLFKKKSSFRQNLQKERGECNALFHSYFAFSYFVELLISRFCEN
jgi:hypothetical protein